MHDTNSLVIREDMTEEQICILDHKYYTNLLSLTDNVESNIDKLLQFYIERIHDTSSRTAVKETIHEYLTLFILRGIDGKEIVANKIAMVGRKGDPGKRNLCYLIGCFRNILEYGLSSTNSSIERRLISCMENKFGVRLSAFGRQKLLELSTQYGIVNVLFAINESSTENIILRSLEELLSEMAEEVRND